MGSFLSKRDLEKLLHAEEAAYPSPIPTQMISNGEFAPSPQTEEQKHVEARIQELGDALGHHRGLSRRSFLKTASGMAAAFLAMNEVHGNIFSVSALEASDGDVAAARALKLANQFILDAQVHFIKDDSKAGSNPANMLGIRHFAAGMLNPDMKGRNHKIDDLKFQNFMKEVFFDSDTKIAILSGAPSDDAENWFLSNDQMNLARSLVNDASGSRRLLAHAVITPGQPGWVEEVDRAIEEIKPDSWKGYTMGDPNGPSKYRWRLDDEDLLYPVYERMVKSGIRNICLHKGLLPPGAEQQMPGVTAYAGVDDVGKAAKDWPELNFIIYHCAFNVLNASADQRKQFEETGHIDWVSQLAAIPGEFGVDNVYAEIGSSFGLSTVMNPRFCAGMMGTLIKGFGHENVFWGTDSVWYGSPQWQIEAFRRMEIPDDLQEKFGFKPLGDEDGAVKSSILGLNTARHYGIDAKKAVVEMAGDALTKKREEYLAEGADRSNLAYGFIARQI